MKQIALGDTHGRKDWKRILDQDFDRAIFIGDYFDTHEDTAPVEQLHNFLEICEYKRKSDRHIILLIGNHDHHYWPGIDETYSGYNARMRQSFQKAIDVFCR